MGHGIQLDMCCAEFIYPMGIVKSHVGRIKVPQAVGVHFLTQRMEMDSVSLQNPISNKSNQEGREENDQEGGKIEHMGGSIYRLIGNHVIILEIQEACVL